MVKYKIKTCKLGVISLSDYAKKNCESDPTPRKTQFYPKEARMTKNETDFSFEKYKTS